MQKCGCIHLANSYLMWDGENHVHVRRTSTRLDRNASPVAAAGMRCSAVLHFVDVQKFRRLRAVYFRVTYQWFLCCGIIKTLLWRLSSLVVQHVVQLRGNSAEADGGERLHHGWVVAARSLLLRGPSVFATCVLLAEAPALESTGSRRASASS